MTMKRLLIITLFIFSAILAYVHLHLIEKDFLELLGIADGIWLLKNYCFQQLQAYVGIPSLTGITTRPPLVPFALTISFVLFNHTLKAIYLVYIIPRLFIAPLLFGISLFFFSPLLSYFIATLPFFFPYFETYAVATLKADVFVVFWTLAGLYFFLRWRSGNKPLDVLLASICLAANFLSKETATLISICLWGFLGFEILKNKNRMRNITVLILPIIFLIGPFIIFSINSTGRILPSLYATAYNPATFIENFNTYLLSIPFYMGVSFTAGKIIAAISLLKLILLFFGVIEVVRKKYWFLLIPPLASLVGIGLMDSKVVQGDIVGNREILHRIAFIVPFVALLIGFGIKKIASLITLQRYPKAMVATILLLIIESIFVYWYFRAPFALDYTNKEFYVNAQTALTSTTILPFSQFTTNQNQCITTFVPAGSFLVETFRPYKISPFPQYYKEFLIGVWLLPIISSAYYTRFKR